MHLVGDKCIKNRQATELKQGIEYRSYIPNVYCLNFKMYIILYTEIPRIWMFFSSHFFYFDSKQQFNQNLNKNKGKSCTKEHKSML